MRQRGTPSRRDLDRGRRHATAPRGRSCSLHSPLVCVLPDRVDSRVVERVHRMTVSPQRQTPPEAVSARAHTRAKGLLLCRAKVLLSKPHARALYLLQSES